MNGTSRGGLAGTRIAIAGGGIGGLTAAIALRREGIEARVFERAPELQAIGAGIHLWTNAVRVLRELDVASGLESLTPVHHVAEFRSWNGRLLSSWPIESFEEKHGAPTIAVSRRDLYQALAAKLDADALVFNATFSSFSQDDEGVTVRFADGREERFDALVGADGLRSAVREQLVGDVPLRYAGYTARRGVLDFELPSSRPGVFCDLFGPGARFVFYDIAYGRLYWMSVANGPAGGRDNGPGGAKAWLFERHAGWMAPVEELIAGTRNEDIHRTDIYDIKPLRQWTQGRVTLLGDAAHAMTFNLGQGAAQAIEDALVLARTLSATGANLPMGLRAYELRRRARTARLQRMAWNIGRLAQSEGRVTTTLRDVVMRTTWPTVGLRKVEQDMAYRF